MPRDAILQLLPFVQVPENTDNLAEALTPFIESFNGAFATINLSFFTATHVEPGKPLENMIRLADGTDWDPGSGRGLYQYREAIWHFLG